MKDIKERIFFSRRAKLLQLSRDAAGSPSSPDDASPSDQTSKEVGCQKENLKNSKTGKPAKRLIEKKKTWKTQKKTWQTGKPAISLKRLIEKKKPWKTQKKLDKLENQLLA